METLLFVYNVDAGLGDGVIRFFYKLLRPQSYPCGLCAVTFDTLAMKENWKRFLITLPQECRFLHRDEFLSLYELNPTDSFPAAFGVTSSGLIQLLTSRELNQAQTLEQLMSLVQEILPTSTNPA